MGTPAVTASNTEFHPQCDTNPPTAPCSSTSRCGEHDMTTSPLPLVRRRKPSGKMSASRSGPVTCSKPGGGRTTHRNRWPLVSRPTATCLICSTLNTPKLPKQRNNTLALGCASSQARHSWRSVLSSSRGFISGPMQCSGGVRRPGNVQRPATMASAARRSREWQLFTITPCELHTCSDKARKCLLLTLSRSN
ncbi:Os01g0735450 [Oryza sativa Japonica Group]|uniref:Os01g0735450 protein n=2 Tax=Oryza sativa subsp. japonica TaxID=39947 RepID=C7IXW6_ORYSJ|nr:hypothetical protein EE612_005561 [Oryza sativa]BAH91288.1 Os01g0735450 [Oryza sativa Japonica Group]BAS74221.1 Os01g0735450 [Oryza sativa Japonica Group]|eukprot:NP_001172558.1 Os01g0735450 [Oryza sativa Japonica Group]